MKTKVKFVIEPGNSVLAYFPDITPFLRGKGLLPEWRTCYGFVCGHTQCTAEYAEALKEATPQEYGVMYQELTSQGYTLTVLNSPPHMVYVVCMAEWDPMPVVATDEQHKEESIRQDNFYTLEEFQRAFNDEQVSPQDCQIRILEG